MKPNLILLVALLLAGAALAAQEWIQLQVLGYESYPGQVVIKTKPVPSLKGEVPCLARVYLECNKKEFVVTDSTAVFDTGELQIDAGKLLRQCEKDSTHFGSFRDFFEAAKKWEIQPLTSKK